MPHAAAADIARSEFDCLTESATGGRSECLPLVATLPAADPRAPVHATPGEPEPGRRTKDGEPGAGGAPGEPGNMVDEAQWQPAADPANPFPVSVQL